jgi:ABC-type transporter lipoprotein component MlaA
VTLRVGTRTPWWPALLLLIGAAVLAGCAARGRAEMTNSGALTLRDAPEDGAIDLEGQDYDPWERFNERMFAFN